MHCARAAGKLELNRNMARVPLTEKNTLYERPDGIVKDEVWIQVESRSAQSRAVYDAAVEQEKIDQIVESKEARLRKFQSDVRKRVSKISRAQREVLSKKQSENMKVEQEVLYRSVAAAENLTPRKNRCSYNINQVTIDASGKLTANFNHNEPNSDGCSELLKQMSEVKRLHHSARQNLAQRSIVKLSDANVSDQDTDEVGQELLPGGFWGTGVSRDKSARILLPSKLANCNEEKGDSQHLQTITAVPAPCDIAIAAVQESITASPILKTKLQSSVSSVAAELPTVLRLNDHEGTNQENEGEFIAEEKFDLTPTTVHFKSRFKDCWQKQDVIPCEESPPMVSAVTQLENISSRCNASTVKSHHCPTAESSKSSFPVAAPGVIEHQKRKMDERSRLLSRRVFSDMERERVREERRKREHRDKVEKLRAEKEAQRQQFEREHDDQVHAAEIEQERLRVVEKMKHKRKERKKQNKLDKQRKNERFVAALRAKIQEKLEFHNITLPPLCGCSGSFWGTNPYTCANNCLFYKNMNAYTTALQSVLTTMERGMTSSSRHDKTQDRSVISLLLSKDN